MNKIKCPSCGTQIELQEALSKQLETSIRTKLESEVNEKSKLLDLELKELYQKEQSIDERFQLQLVLERKVIVEEERTKLIAEQSEQTQSLTKELEEKRLALSEANKKELKLRQQQRDLEDEKEKLALTVQRTIDDERKEIYSKASKKAAEEQALLLSTKDNLLTQMTEQISELKRRADVGSQEAQGEALEKNLQSVLQKAFQFDTFTEVKKGITGGDIIQTVFNAAGRECGTILWEIKNTKLFSRAWIEKLKNDQQNANCDIAVLMTIAQIKEVENCGLYEDIWITNYKSALGLATALRHGLLEVTRQKAVNAGNTNTKDLIYQYVTGKEFAMHIKIVVSAFTKMQEELDAEERALNRIWKKRRKQLEAVVSNLSGMRGSIEGISQKALPDVDMSLEEIGDDNE